MNKRSLLAFVFRPGEITSSVIEMASLTGATALFDLTCIELQTVRKALPKVDTRGDAVHALVSSTAFMNASFEKFLGETAVTDVWVELHPLLCDHGLDAFFIRLRELSRSYRFFPIIADIDLITKALKEYPDIPNIVLKGCEASGFVSRESTLSLFAAVRHLLSRQQHMPDLLIWGGIGTPEGASAFLSTGAKGIVFESLHWLTDMAGTDQKICQQISRLRPESTRIVGLALQVPFRVFDKGNSLAVKELDRFEAFLNPEEITDQKRRTFARRVQGESVLPGESRFDRNELVPLGVEACFARAFVEQYGHRTDQAVTRFMSEVNKLCYEAGERRKSFIEGSLANEMGIQYPFIQGAMTWITDVVEFAIDIADAGGLPTFALGLMDRETLEQKLGKLPEIMKHRPYAVNLLALPENPFLDVQLAWVKEIKPPFVVIGAGDPSLAGEIREQGSEAIYIAPNADLLKLAFQSGARYAICEGNEAGGHVGGLTMLTFAQAVIEQRRRAPSLFKDRRVILAGGIFNGDTASIAALLGADAIQMGTVYLATKEIVKGGGLSKFYQHMILTSSFGSTVVTGEVAGLPVRSLETDKVKAIRVLERNFLKGNEDETSFRRKIEELTAGSLFIAARGLDRPGGTPISEVSCLEQGQFMSGVCAGIIDRIRPVKQLHRELEEDLMKPAQWAGHAMQKKPDAGSETPRSAGAGALAGNRLLSRAYHPLNACERIAITGFSMINSLGNRPQEIWTASMDMKSGVTLVPPSKWNHESLYDPRPHMAEKTYCKVGAFKNTAISRKALGIPPHDFRTMSGSTKETLYLAQQAIERSGIVDSNIPRERIGVLVSQNSGECPGTLEDIIVRASIKRILGSVKKAVQLTPELELAVEQELKSGCVAIDDTTLTGRLNSTAAGFICNRYGFMGPSYAVSAACASSLAALYSAVQMIRNGSIDAAVVGGGEESLTPLHFLEFSALKALAGLSGVERPPEACSRPFDAERDGIVLGEGGGIIVIERESVAIKRGANVHAYVTGVGGSNTPTGLVEPSSLSEEIAIRSSFRDTVRYGPGDVDLVECHATGTVQGDLEEIKALRSVFNGQGYTMMSSFKSQIGHTLGAAGINSLIRGILAMRACVFPPTLNCEHPDTALGIEGSGLVLLKEPSEWKVRNGQPRRVQINAFGFGGFNYVAQMEECRDASGRQLVLPERESKAFLRAQEDNQYLKGVSFFRSQIESQQVRVAVVSESQEKARAKIEEIRASTENISLHPKRLRYLARKGIYLGLEKESPPPMAFAFPGQGSQYTGMGKELYEQFPKIREWMDRFSVQADFNLLQFLFQGEEEDLKRTLWLQPALFSFEYAMAQHLMSLGVSPVAVAGHSVGEFTALCTAGVFSAEDGFRLVAKRGECMDRVASMDGDAGVMMAVNAPSDLLEKMIPNRKDICICNSNSPNQVVVGGKPEAVSALGHKLKEMEYRVTLLKVSMAFHSPVMCFVRGELEGFIASIPCHAPRIPVMSNTTGRPFPSNPEEIKRIVLAHLESPVHWMQCVQTLRNDCGIKVFVEIGPGDVLTNLIKETLETPDCVRTCLPLAESATFRTALAKLYVYGSLNAGQDAQFIPLSTLTRVSENEQKFSQSHAHETSEAITDPRTVEGIIRRQYSALMAEPFGRLLKRSLLNSVRLQHDPSFTEERLDKALDSISLDLGDHTPGKPSPTEEAVSSLQQKPRFEGSKGPDTPRPKVGDPSGVIEDLIVIIMDATGYERDEIDSDMHLKDELAIRSSRLPVIMDAAERRFGITIQLEDFMDVRTVRDAARKISDIMSRDGSFDDEERDSFHRPDPQTQGSPRTREEVEATKRVVFDELSLETGRFLPVELACGDSIIVFSAGRPTRLSKKFAEIFSRDYGVLTSSLAFMKKGSDLGAAGFDIRTEREASRCAASLREITPPAGLVFVVDDVLDGRIEKMEDVSRLLQGLFLLVKAFLQSPARKFTFLVSYGEDAKGHSGLIAEGMLGLFLSAGLEYGSVQFRTLLLDQNTDLGYAIRCALDTSRPAVENIYRRGEAFSSAGRVNPSLFRDEPCLNIGPGDVVVLSGGGRGITSHLARAFIPFGNRVVLLGRTPFDPGLDYEGRVSKADTHEKGLYQSVEIQKPESPMKRIGPEISRLIKCLEISRTLKDLQSSGIEASYMPCNVTDRKQVQAIMGEIFKQYGKIAGVIHGAGLLKDALIKNMSRKDFSDVMNVKLLGAWNLFHAAERLGLRFFAALSSVAAVLGSPGQANYSSANRALTALIRRLGQKNPHVLSKSLILPPISGTGMAEDPEIRDLMRMKGMEEAYVPIDELRELFCRELFTANADDSLVMFMRRLPKAKTSRLDSNDVAPKAGRIKAGSMTFLKELFPLIDSVLHIDMGAGKLQARRTFSREKDLWIEDHKPFKAIKHPMISAVMAIEAFMEASRLLYPYLHVQGIRKARFLEWVECPAGIERPSEIACRRIGSGQTEIVCDVSLSSQDISPIGRAIPRMSVNFKAQVVLSGQIPHHVDEPPGFSVQADEMDTPAMDREALLEWYRERSDFKERYRVVTYLEGTGAGVIRGKTMCQERKDFSDYPGAQYQYSPYLLEAVFHLVASHTAIRDRSEERFMIPIEITELILGRRPEYGEEITLTCRMTAKEGSGSCWDAGCVDEQGRVIMHIRGIRMRWLSV